MTSATAMKRSGHGPEGERGDQGPASRMEVALVTAAEEWFRAQGLAISELHVLYANESGRQFWEEAGYQPLAMGMRKKL